MRKSNKEIGAADEGPCAYRVGELKEGEARQLDILPDGRLVLSDLVTIAPNGDRWRAYRFAGRLDLSDSDVVYEDLVGGLVYRGEALPVG